jgi:hypothetical protein
MVGPGMAAAGEDSMAIVEKVRLCSPTKKERQELGSLPSNVQLHELSHVDNFFLQVGRD